MTRALASLCVLLSAAAQAQDIKVEGTLGTLDDAAVQLAVERQAGAIGDCFKEHGQTLRYLGGAVRLRLRVARDGAVKSAAPRSDLGSWPVERCLLQVARGLRFARPRGGEAEVELPLELPARSAALPVDGAELAAKLEALPSCPGRPADVQVTVYVGPGGRVTSAGFSTEEAFSDAWGDCAEAKVKALKLRDPRGKVVKATARLEP